MSKPELKDQLKSLESYFNIVPFVLDPCKICKNYDEEKGYKEECSICCYYYGSNFEVKI
ncbi:MAG: hypothetical protein II453_12920 [Alphaproteobacteria bacterium]|nr:hypothetical protein [Alphaproteobacteria bacterium]